MTDKYAAQRALIELEAKRLEPDYPGDTVKLPVLQAPAAETDDTVPMLPALLRPQA